MIDPEKYLHMLEDLKAARERIAELEAQLAQGGEPVATVESFTNGSYSRNYKLRFHQDVQAGTPLYTRSAPDADVMRDAALCSLLPGTYYMDPPDGGSVTPLEQCCRMAKDAARYRWLRNQNPVLPTEGPELTKWEDESGDALRGEEADKAIDAAVAKGGV